jgi:hypothetical protein
MSYYEIKGGVNAVKNRLKRVTLKIMLDTPIVSIGLIILVFAVAWIISSNAYVYKYMNVSGTIISSDGVTGSTEIAVTITADIPFEGNLKNATWTYENSDKVYEGIYESDKVVDGMREIRYRAQAASADGVAEKPIKLEIATQKLTLAQHIVRSLISYGNK